MLQFATSESSHFSIKEQVDLAIKAGFRWIRLSDSIAESSVKELIPICQEAETILILDNDIKLVDKLRIHGVHLTQWTRGKVIATREELGPHAILGLTCDNPSNLNELSGLDVDYIVIQNPTSEDPIDYYKKAIEHLRNSNKEIHAVAEGDGLSIAIYPKLISSGFEGFELSGSILDAPDPSAFISLAMQANNHN